MPREQGALTWLTIRVLAMLAVPAWRISMPRVLIIGASKGIGLETTRQGLEAGYQVRALARSPQGLVCPIQNSRKSTANGLISKDIEAGPNGIEVVIRTLGVFVGVVGLNN